MTDKTIQRYRQDCYSGVDEPYSDDCCVWIREQDHLKAMEAKDAMVELRKSTYEEGAKHLKKRIKHQQKLIEEQSKEIERLKDFVIWMTGADYDFTKHPYYLEKMKELVK